MEQNTTQHLLLATLHFHLYPNNRKSCFFTLTEALLMCAPRLDQSQRCTTGKWGNELSGMQAKHGGEVSQCQTGTLVCFLVHQGEFQSF